MKTLNFVYNWIGPNGPLPNHKIPDIYDFAKKADHVNVDYSNQTDEHDTMAFDISKFVNCNYMPVCQLTRNNDTKFIYEIVLSPKNYYLQKTLCIGSGYFENVPVQEKILDLVRFKNGYIMLSCKHESFVEDDDFDIIHNYFEYHNIPLEKIIYATNCVNANELYEKYCLSKKIKPKLKCEYLNLYLLDQKNIANRKSFIRFNPNLRNKEKLFLNWNRRVKNHRIVFLLYLIRNNLFDRCYVSFSKLHTSLDSWLRDAHALSKQFNLGFTIADLTEIYQQLPIVLDSNNFDRFPIEDDMFTTSKWYDRSYISVVSETNFQNNVVHMTEKTVKPILFKQPFIIIGPMHTLKHMKEMGFQTFNEFWDESYDEIENSKERFTKIMNLCDHIASWSEKDLFKFSKRSLETVNHNFKVMQNLKPDDLLNFANKYGI